MADGDDTVRLRLRPAAPSFAGPLGSSGAAPGHDERPAADATGTKVEPGRAGTTDGEAGKDEAGKDEAGKDEGEGSGADEPRRRIRVPFADKVRRPGEKAAGAARTVRGWVRKPRGRLVMLAALAVLVLGAAVAAGAIVVPTALRGAPAPAPPPSAPATTGPGTWTPTGSAAPGLGDPLPSAATSGPPSGPVVLGAGGGRPADALRGWAAQVAAATEIPVVAVQAYGYAELVAARNTPACRLSWTTLAAIGKVESAHGSANGATMGADGQALPAIKGLPLDGQGGRMLIADTDRGLLDGDQQYDRAVGPMQFIPATWRETAVDADDNGVTDPNDIDDAAMAAANYLCRGARNMSTSEDWWAAILSYNDVRRYAQDVYTAANDYGLRSRT